MSTTRKEATKLVAQVAWATAWLLAFGEWAHGDEIPADECEKAVLIQQVPAGRVQFVGAVEKVNNLGLSFRLANQTEARFFPWKTVFAVRTTKADYFPDTKAKPFRKSLAKLDPGNRLPRLIGPLDATVRLENGNQADGMLTSLIAEEVGFQAPGVQYAITYPANFVRSVKVGNDMYVRNTGTNLLEKSMPADKKPADKIPGDKEPDEKPPDDKKPVDKKLPEDAPPPGSWPRKGVLIAQDGRQYAADITSMDDQQVRIETKAPGRRISGSMGWIELRKVMIETGDYTFDAIGKRARFTAIEGKQSGKVRVLGPLPATITLTNGTSSRGTLVSLDGNELGFQEDKNDHGITYTGIQVQTVRTMDSTYVWDRNSGRFARQDVPVPANSPGAGSSLALGLCCWFIPFACSLFVVYRLVVGNPCPKCRRWRAGKVACMHLVGRGKKEGTITYQGSVEMSRTGGETYEVFQDELYCKHRDCRHHWYSRQYEVVAHNGPMLLLTLPFFMYQSFRKGRYGVKR